MTCRATAILGAPQQAGVVARDRAHEHARLLTLEPVGRDAGILERLPGELQHEALLRVHRRGLPGGDAEEAGVELVDAVQVPPVLQAPRGVVGIGESVQRPALGRGLDDRVAALTQKRPERVGVRRAGQAARHADHGDGVAKACPWPLRTVAMHHSIM